MATLTQVAPAPTERLIADNRKARHDYHISDVYEAGIVLLGAASCYLPSGRSTS